MTYRILILIGLLLPATGFALPPQSSRDVLHSLPVPGDRTVVVDGVLADGEWERAGRMFVYNAAKLRQRYSVEVYSMWDAEAWYLAMHYLDPTPLVNNVDPVSSPFDGWQADAFQGRFTTDYGQIHFDAWYGSKHDTTVGVLSYNRPVNTADSKTFHGKGMRVSDPSGFQQAFRLDPDGRGYTQEIRIPWKLLYKTDPQIRAGHKFRFTGEYYWGGPTGIRWPKVMWSDPINPKLPQRVVLYQNPHVWGEVELVADRSDAKNDPVQSADDDRRVQGPIPIRFTVPADAVKFSLAIDELSGQRVRNLVSGADLKDYVVGSDAAGKTIEVPWDGRVDGGWDKDRQLFLGDFARPGKYTARVIVHQSVGVTHAGSFYNPGTPPWPTADGKGSWLSDHAPPMAVTTMPVAAKTTGRVFLLAHQAESGVPLIGLDSEGRKLWQWGRGMSEMHAADCSRQHLYLAYSYAGKPQLTRLNPSNGQPVALPDNRQDIPLPQKATAVAVSGDGKLVAVATSKQLLLFDGNTFSRKPIELRGPLASHLHELTHLTLAPDGRLLAVAAAQIFAIDTSSGHSSTIPIPNAKPHSLAFDDDGRLYVTDGLSSTVHVYQRPGGERIGVIGQSGGRKPGPWRNQCMAAPRSLAVEQLADGTRQLWCVEGIYHPRRVVVWDVTDPAKSKIARDYIGGTNYMGSGGLLSDDTPDLGIAYGVEFKIDYENYDYRPVRLMSGRPDPAKGLTSLFAIGEHSGAFSNGFHFISKVSGREHDYYVEGNGVCQVFMRRGDRWHCVAALGHADHGIKFPAGFPQADRRAGKTHFAWNDHNGDGYQQPGEVHWEALGNNNVLLHGKSWGYRCDRELGWYHSDRAIKPAKFSATGAPIYDLSNVNKLPGELGSRGHKGEIFKTRFGYVLQAKKPGYQDPHGTIHGLMQLEGYDNNGRLRWTYPAYWHSVHGAFTAPMAMPGVIMGALKITGIVKPGSSDGRDVIALRGNIGQEFLIRDDGLYVGELFTDQRMAPDELPSDERIAGAPLNATTLGGEPFSGWIARQRDGRVRMTYGQNDVRIAEVVGLDTVQERPAISIDLSKRQVELAKAFQPRRVAQRITEFVIQRGEAFDHRRWPNVAEQNDSQRRAHLSLRSGRDEVAQVGLRFDDQHLYAAWHVSDLTPLVNKGSSPELVFKSGDCVGLLLSSSKDAKANQLGGTRVTISMLRGKPIAVVYRPRSGGPNSAAKPFTFESPVRKSHFHYVSIEPSIAVQVQRNKLDYVVTAAIPWTVIGIKPLVGTALRADAEVIFGGTDAVAVERIVRWVDRQTNVVNDTPTEAEFFPVRWGTFYLGNSIGSPKSTEMTQTDDRWMTVYEENFDNLPAGLKTTQGQLSHWEGGAASGVVRNGGPESSSGSYLAANHAWGHFNFGPIFNLDLSKHAHSKVRVSFDLYTFGDWRGNQHPPHRIGFGDQKATHPHLQYFSFATVTGQKQSWPDTDSSRIEHAAATGATPDNQIDTAASHTGDHRWPFSVEYTSSNDQLRFTILGGMHDFGPDPRIAAPYFGVDNVRVDVFQENR